MRTTAIMNLKGGTAKTVTAINLAAILAHDYAQRILLVDADSQANLTEFVAGGPVDDTTPGGFGDLLRGMHPFALPTKIPDVKILIGDSSLMELDVTAVSSGIANPMALAEYLETVVDRYDWCIVDCPPAFSAGAMAALVAADEVVIPMKLDAFGIRGVANLLEQIRNMRRINPDLEVRGVLPTMTYPDPTQIEAERKLRDSLAALRITTFNHIRRSALVDRSTFDQAPLVTASPKSKTLRDYRIFAKRLIGDYLDADTLKGGEL